MTEAISKLSSDMTDVKSSIDEVTTKVSELSDTVATLERKVGELTTLSTITYAEAAIIVILIIGLVVVARRK